MARGGNNVGLDISTGSIKVAEVTYGKQEPILKNLSTIMLPEGLVHEGEIEDPEAMSSYIRDLWKQGKFGRRRVVLGISNQKVIVRPMEIPYMPEEELETAVKYQIQEFIPIPIEDAIVGYEVVDEYMTGEEERMQTILLAVAHRDMVQKFMEAVGGAGLGLEAVELKSFAMARSLMKKEYQFMEEEASPPGSVCLINVGAGICNICIVKENTPRFVRMLMRGGDFFTNFLVDHLNIAPAEAEEVKRGVSMSEEANALLQREIQAFVNEIRRSLEYYISQTQERDLNRVVLSGSGSKMINLPLELNRGLKLPIEIGHPLQNVTLGKFPYTPEELTEMEASIAVCIGLALRGTEE